MLTAIAVLLTACGRESKQQWPPVSAHLRSQLQAGKGTPFLDTPGIDEECDRQLTRMKPSTKALKDVLRSEPRIDWNHVVGGGFPDVEYLTVRGGGKVAYVMAVLEDLRTGQWHCPLTELASGPSGLRLVAAR